MNRQHFTRSAINAALVAALGSWLIGRACHVLGLHHTGGHALAEIVVLFAAVFVAALVLERRR